MTREELLEKLKSLRPPTRQWAIAEAIVLALALFGIALGAMTPPPVSAAAPSAPGGALLVRISDEHRTALARDFASHRTKPSERVSILSELAESIETRGMTLQSRTLEAPPISYPPREVHRLVMTGRPAAQVDFVRELTQSRHPIRITDLTWAAGDSPGERSLQVVIEILTE